MDKGTLLIPAVLVGACLLIAACIQDFRTAKPVAEDVLIMGKDYTPGHYHTSCDGHHRCSTHWVPPSWDVEYADEGRHFVSVSEGMYEALHIGDKVVIRFNLGGGPWHLRYSERFVLGKLDGEGQKW